MRSISKNAITTTVVMMALSLVACGTGAVSPRYGVYVTGTQALNDVDTAWDIAAQLAGVDAASYAHRTDITVNVQSDAIIISDSNTRFHGLSTNELGMAVCRVQVVGASLLDAESPTVHELLHSILFLRDGNEDDNHSAAIWHDANRDYTKEEE